MPIKNYILIIPVVQQFRGKDNRKELIYFIKFSHHLVIRSLMIYELQILYLVSDNSIYVTCTGDPLPTITTTSRLLPTVTSAETTQTTGIIQYYFFSLVKAIQ